MEGAGFSRLTLSEGVGRVQGAAPDTRRNSLNSASSTVELDFEMYMGDDPLAARAEALSYSQTLDDGSKHDDMLANFSEHEIFALCNSPLHAAAPLAHRAPPPHLLTPTLQSPIQPPSLD